MYLLRWKLGVGEIPSLQTGLDGQTAQFQAGSTILWTFQGFRGEPPAETATLPNPTHLYETRPARIIDRRWVMEEGQQVQQVLVEWEDRGREEATWEQWDNLCQAFPNGNLEDKVLFHGESIVMTGKEGEQPKDVESIVEVMGQDQEPNTEGAEGEESSGPATEGDGPEGEHGTRATRVRQPPVWLKDFVR
ncbi:Transposon Ty3-G Gag-Pol polyprotein [Senna tora]|uniref:Transposon Ty3-G Gag-Pol polyprotein n=1 Tax=Senna tora TaxID=362788 RepID=A0A834WS62_9FABA|nr:Transposon Ty3-G Gag-Pol polyprotein [Senna tora]